MWKRAALPMSLYGMMDTHTCTLVNIYLCLSATTSFPRLSLASQVGYIVAHCPHTQAYSLPSTGSLADLSLTQKNLNSPLLTLENSSKKDSVCAPNHQATSLARSLSCSLHYSIFKEQALRSVTAPTHSPWHLRCWPGLQGWPLLQSLPKELAGFLN